MSSVVSVVRDHLTDHLAGAGYGAPSSASVTFLGLEPMGVLRFVGAADAGGAGGPGARGPGSPEVVLASLGCSAHPMADPGDLLAAEDGPRAEVLLRIRPTTNVQLTGVHRAVAVLGAAPAVEGLVLAPDGLVDLGQPLWDGAPFTAVLLGDSTVPHCPVGAAEGVAKPVSVTFFESVPITANEAAWVRLKGAAALREAWAEAGIDPADPGRRAASL